MVRFYGRGKHQQSSVRAQCIASSINAHKHDVSPMTQGYIQNIPLDAMEWCRTVVEVNVSKIEQERHMVAELPQDVAPEGETYFNDGKPSPAVRIISRNIP